jgi:serine protease AprX
MPALTAAEGLAKLTGSPASRTVTRGAGTTYTVTVTPLNGFSGSVSLSVSGLPSRTSASFSPNPTTSSSTLSVTTSRKTSTGTYRLTITGTSGGFTHTSVVSLTVQ